MAELCSDWMDRKRPFYCGVCEGFYGKPWTLPQRKDLFEKMHVMGLTTYLYAPKDDYKHRLYWRDSYTEKESADLEQLIQNAIKNNITFVYAISPGLDIVYSDLADQSCLINKLQQVEMLGCTSFALLFDDIEGDLEIEDAKLFDDIADAQAHLTNLVLKQLNEPKVFLFCPTEYCSSRAVPDVASSKYLETIGKKLAPQVDIAWTGTRVVTHTLDVEHVKEIGRILQRPVVIWDNLHANDYDQTRLYLGPYIGRSPELRNYMNGVLTNPNCEYEANYVPIHTLAQWSKDTVQSFYPSDIDGGSTAMDVDTSHYQPRLALAEAAYDWLNEFYKQNETTSDNPSNLTTSVKPLVKIYPPSSNNKRKSNCTDKVRKNSGKSSKLDSGRETDNLLPDADTNVYTTEKSLETNEERQSHEDISMESASVQTDIESENNKTDEKSSDSGQESRKKTIRDLPKLTRDEIILLCDLFYLPTEHGPHGVKFLREGHWLLNNVEYIKDCYKMPRGEQPVQAKEWFERAVQFHTYYRDIAFTVDKFVNIPNRKIVYELYTYIGDMKSLLSMINTYIKWNGLGRVDKEPFRGEQEPWVHRGGLYSELRRILPIDGCNDMFLSSNKEPPANSIFTIRPYFKSDKDDVYAVCRKTCDDGFDGSHMFPQHPDLIADESIGGLIDISPQYCFVLEDDSGICGYVVATPDIRKYQTELTKSWMPLIKEKYPHAHGKVEESPDDGSQTMQCDIRPVPDALYNQYPGFMLAALVCSRVPNRTMWRRLVNTALRTLGAAGVRGVHTAIHSEHINKLALHVSLGFEDVTDLFTGQSDDDSSSGSGRRVLVKDNKTCPAANDSGEPISEEGTDKSTLPTSRKDKILNDETPQCDQKTDDEERSSASAVSHMDVSPEESVSQDDQMSNTGNDFVLLAKKISI